MRAGSHGAVWPGLALAAVIAALYGPALGRYFTSEDFLLLRFLGEHPPWRDLPGTLAGPWLGITIVKFYRPVATTLFALEGTWFGAHPLPYNVVHVAVHVASALLVAALARRLARRFVPGPEDRRGPWLAALLFAVYPLHPNAVLFAASFATIFGTLFLLGAAVLYSRHRESGGAGSLVAALACFVLGLGSYESAVVLVGILAALEVLSPRDRRGAAVALAPFVALAAGYLALRRMIFGVVIGGYDDVADRLAGSAVATHADNLVTSIHRLALPLFDARPSWAASLVSVGLLVLVPAGLAVASHRRVASGHLRLFVWCVAWVLASMAPFAFVPVVPANGRYWYTATIGAGIGLVTLARWLGAAFPRLGPAAIVVPLAAAVGWGWMLSAHVTLNREAGRTARAIQLAVAKAAADDRATRRYVTGYPLFLTNRAGVNMAQVYHYGLADALGQPFTPGPPIHVYPLPSLPPAVFAPLAGLDGAILYRWAPTEERLHALSPPAPPRGLAATGPPDGADVSAASSPVLVEVPSEPGQLVRLVVLAAGNWTLVDRRAGAGPVTSLALPLTFVRAMARLYPGREMLWWAVVQQGGRVVATSQVRRVISRSEQVAVTLGVVKPPAKVLDGIPAERHRHQ